MAMCLPIDRFRRIKVQLKSEAYRIEQRKLIDQVYSFLSFVSLKPHYQDEI